MPIDLSRDDDSSSGARKFVNTDFSLVLFKSSTVPVFLRNSLIG